MKRFKIIALFLLIFSFGFSEEGSQEEKLQARVIQLEQQIETQNKIIARYERLEDKISDRLLESSSLNYNVDQFYNSKWDKLESHLDRALNAFMWIIGLAFTGIGVLIPLYQKFFVVGKIEKSIENHEADLVKHDKYLEEQKKYLDDQANYLIEQEEKFQEKIEVLYQGIEKRKEELREESYKSLDLKHRIESLDTQALETYNFTLDLFIENYLKELKSCDKSEIEDKMSKVYFRITVFLMYFNENIRISTLSGTLLKICNALEIIEKREIEDKEFLLNKVKKMGIFKDNIPKYAANKLEECFQNDKKLWTEKKKDIIKEMMNIKYKKV